MKKLMVLILATIICMMLMGCSNKEEGNQTQETWDDDILVLDNGHITVEFSEVTLSEMK